MYDMAMIQKDQELNNKFRGKNMLHLCNKRQSFWINRSEFRDSFHGHDKLQVNKSFKANVLTVHLRLNTISSN